MSITPKQSGAVEQLAELDELIAQAKAFGVTDFASRVGMKSMQFERRLLLAEIGEPRPDTDGNCYREEE
jgi:hypothetical protein